MCDTSDAWLLQTDEKQNHTDKIITHMFLPAQFLWVLEKYMPYSTDLKKLFRQFQLRKPVKDIIISAFELQVKCICFFFHLM